MTLSTQATTRSAFQPILMVFHIAMTFPPFSLGGYACSFSLTDRSKPVTLRICLVFVETMDTGCAL